MVTFVQRLGGGEEMSHIDSGERRRVYHEKRKARTNALRWEQA